MKIKLRRVYSCTQIKAIVNFGAVSVEDNGLSSNLIEYYFKNFSSLKVRGVFFKGKKRGERY